MINIHARVKHLKEKYGTGNPKQLSKELHIEIIQKEYSTYTKGYFIKTLRNKFIVVNSNLDTYSQNIVLAHELGHAILHSSEDIYFIREQTLFPVGRYEIEANKFAAELLIDDSEIYYLKKSELSIPEMSKYLSVPEKLIQYKLLK